MIFNLPSGLFHDNKKAFIKWHENNEIVDFCIGILSIIITLLLAFIPHLSNIIIEYYNITIVLFVICLAYCLFKFFKWKAFNFKKTTVDINSLMIITHKNELLTIDVDENIIIPSEDILRLNLKLKFDRDLIEDLKKYGEYELIFVKPTNLEIEYKEKPNIDFEIVKNDKYSEYYKVKFKYRFNEGDSHIFELESDLDTTGNLMIFFRTPANERINTNGLFKDNHLFCKSISTTEVIIGKE